MTKEERALLAIMMLKEMPWLLRTSKALEILREAKRILKGTQWETALPPGDYVLDVPHGTINFGNLDKPWEPGMVPEFTPYEPYEKEGSG